MTVLFDRSTCQWNYETVPRTERLREVVRESNRQGKDAWQRFGSHRQHVRPLLAGTDSDGTSTLCILGPGNVNDVHLGELLDQFGEVHLVDIDITAVGAGIVRQRVNDLAGWVVHEPTDLTGVFDLLAAASDLDAATRLVEALAQRHCAVSGSPFDVCVSMGVLTQLLQSVVDSDLARPDVARVAVSMRDKHLRDLIELTRPGGLVILVTDVVSTTTAPGLLEVNEVELESEMARLVAVGNFFTGTNPYRIVALLEEDPGWRALVSDVRLVDPWLWAVTADREHLTCAIVARRC